jgi:hypothetical protein
VVPGRKDSIIARVTLEDGARVAVAKADEARLILFDVAGAETGLTKASIAELEPRLLIVVTGETILAEYDHDRDGAPDIRLAGPSQPLTAAETAERRSASGWEQEPALVGTKLIQLDLLGEDPPSTHALENGFPPTFVAAGEAPARRFPHLYRDTGPSVRVAKIDGVLLALMAGEPAMAWLGDVDASTLESTGGDAGEVRDALRDGSFDHELALVSAGELLWTYLDLDDAPGPERIVFSTGPGWGSPVAAFTRAGEGFEPTEVPEVACAVDDFPADARPRLRSALKATLRTAPCR